MDFDLSKEYERYSNVELLRIVLLPHQYQPAALAAAQAILATRAVTEEEQRIAAESIAPKPRKAPFMAPEETWQPGKDLFIDADARPAFERLRQLWWLTALLLGLFILYYTEHELTRLFFNRYAMAYASWDRYINILVIGAQITGYIGYWQKKRWGWIVSVTWLCYLFFTGLVSFYVLLTSPFLKQTIIMFFELVLYVGCTLLLCRPILRDFYQVNKRTLQLTIIISSGCTIFYCVAAFLWMYFLNGRMG